MFFLRGNGLMRYLLSGSFFAMPILQSASSARHVQRYLVWLCSPGRPDQLAKYLAILSLRASIDTVM